MTTIQNHLIELLPRRDRESLLAMCERVRLEMGQVLCAAGEATRHVYFPTEAFISQVTMIEDRPVLEVGMIGSEGMLGTQLLLGVARAPLHSLVQGAGECWRVTVAPFRVELERSVPLRRCLGRYLYVSMEQLALSAGCVRVHQIAPRLARWLLMTQDRAHADSFHVTHEFLGYMLGVRRVGITTAAGELQRLGAIEYHRGEVTVLDRPALEAAACGCYATGRRAYAELMD